MALIAKTLSTEDIKRISSGEVNVYVTDFKDSTDIKGSVVDSTIFKSPLARKEGSMFKDESEFMRMGHIELAMPVLNPFLATKNGALYGKIVNLNSMMRILSQANWVTKDGMDKEDYGDVEEEESDYFDDEDDGYSYDEDEDLDKTGKAETKWVSEVMHGDKVFDIEKKSLISPDTLSSYNPNSILIGGEVFKYFNERFLAEIENEIHRELFRLFICPGRGKDEQNMILTYLTFDSCKIVKHPKEPEKLQWIWDDYYIHMKYEPDKIALVQNRDALLVKKGTLQKKSSRLNLLIEIAENPDKLKNMVMTAMLVLPIGVRATVNDRVHELTAAYNDIVIANDNMARSLSQDGLKTKLNSYKALVNIIEYTMVKSGALTKNKNSKQFKAIVTTLAGKKGSIRDKLQAVRLDYSGRSVIAFDRDMPIDSIGIPYEMLYSLLQKDIQRYYLQPRDNESRFKIVAKKASLREVKKNKHLIDILCKDLYGMSGRQPTLHRLGIQGFNIIPVEGKSILLSPLVVMPFNADFDGDQMHVEIPITLGAKQEVKEIMGIIRNLAYPKNGSITVEPRHEILYGLWACSVYCTSKAGKIITSSTLNLAKGDKVEDVIFNKINNQSINIYDDIDIPTSINSGRVKAGLWAIAYCCKGTVKADELTPCDINGSKKAMKYNESFFTKQLTKVAAKCQKELKEGTGNGNEIIEMISNITRLGFNIAKIWVPTLCTEYYPNLDAAMTEFNNKIARRERLVKLGLELDSAYTTYFTQEIEELKKKVSKEMLDKLGLNGLVLMMKAGARGSESNLMQMFGMRGQIMKDSTEAFNAIIKSSLSEQLTPLEHFITAYGSRQGIADKTLETANTGYLTRQLEHICSMYQIEGEDCEDTEGLHWKFEDLYYMNDESVLRDIEHNKLNGIVNYEAATRAIYTKMEKFIVGRSVIITKDDVEKLGTSYKGRSYGDDDVVYYVYDKKIAQKILDGRFEGPDSRGLRLRSPMTCKCPTCKICYGRSMTNLIEDEFIGDDIKPNYPENGTSIANIAAEAIGEPGTQLTMKNFQRGGVKSKANLTSSAKKVNNYFSLFAHKSKDIGTNVIDYDPIAAKRGEVKEVNLGNGTKKVTIVGSGKGPKFYIMHDNVELKPFVEVGESLQLVQGDLDIVEMLQRTPDNTVDRSYSVFKAAKYLITMLHNIFNEETTLNVKHFEVLVAGLIRFTVTKPSKDCRSYGFKVGDCLSIKDYRDLSEYGAGANTDSIDSMKGFWCLYGMNEVNVYKTDFLDTFFMERITTNTPLSMILNNRDSLEHPLTRVSLGAYANFKRE